MRSANYPSIRYRPQQSHTHTHTLTRVYDNVAAKAREAKPQNKRLRELQLILIRQQRTDIYVLVHMYECRSCGCCKHQKKIKRKQRGMFAFPPPQNRNLLAKEFKIAAVVEF